MQPHVQIIYRGMARVLRNRWRCLSIAALVCTGLVAAFVALTRAVLSGDATLVDFDARLGGLLRQQADTPIAAWASWLSALHRPRGIVVLTAAAALVLWFRHERSGIVVLLVSVFGGAWINHLLKHGLQLPRPGMEHAVGVLTDFSFPSGHVANSTLLYGTLAAWTVLHAASRPVRAGAVAAALLMVAAIACSRVVLGVHRPSDVLAGVLVGLAWLALCLAPLCAGRSR